MASACDAATSWTILQLVLCSAESVVGIMEAKTGIVPGIIDEEVLLHECHYSMLLI
jgi:hypothetical protein